MKLIFFDEAKNEAAYPHYHIGAVCIDEAFLAEIEQKVNAIAAAAFGTSELSAATELHAAEIYHRKKNFKAWADFGKRIDIIVQMARILSEAEVRLIDVQINSDRLQGSQSAEEIAFMFLCERANDLVAAHKSLGMLSAIAKTTTWPPDCPQRSHPTELTGRTSPSAETSTTSSTRSIARTRTSAASCNWPTCIHGSCNSGIAIGTPAIPVISQ